MGTQPGIAHVIITLRHPLVRRPAAVTLAVDPTSTNPATVASAVYVAFIAASSLKTLVDSDVVIGPTTAYLGTDGAEDLAGVHTATTVGSAGASAIHQGSAVLLTKLTARGGRRGKGRMYLPWSVAPGNVDETGTIGAGTVTAINAAASTFLSALNSGQVPMMLLHKQHVRKDGSVSIPPAADAVTGLTVSSLISSQRRRLGR